MRSCDGLLFKLVTLGLMLLLGFGLSVALPLNLGADEPAHLHYANFIWTTGHLPDPRVDDIFQAQHPPLYHFLLGGVVALLPGFGEGAKAPPISWPYERVVRVPWDLDWPGALAARWKRPQEGQKAIAAVRYPLLLRWLGLLLALVTAWVIFRSLSRLFPDRRALALLSSATLLLVPQFSVGFATPNNDQTAILFSTLALACLVPDPAAWKRIAWASLWLGLGLLSKLTVIGPCAVASVLVLGASWPAHSKAAKRVLLLGLGPFLLAGWWLVRQMLLAGSLSSVALAAAKHPDILRMTPPDGWEVLQILGGFVRPLLGSLGGDSLTPGEGWFALAVLLPVLLLLGGLGLAASRRAPDRERLLARAFLAGLAVQVASLLMTNRHFLHIHGRYFEVFILPAAWVLCAGSARLFGRRARAVVGALSALMALGGMLLLHGVVIPRYHEHLDPERIPGLILHADLGTRAAQALVRRGLRRVGPQTLLCGPRQRMILGPGSKTGALQVSLVGLPEKTPTLLSLRLFPPSAGLSLASLAHVKLSVAGTALSGLLSSHGRAESWVHLALPLTRTGRLLLNGSGIGAQVGLSEILVQRWPWRLGPLRGGSGHYAVEVKLRGGEPPWKLTLSLLGQTGETLAPEQPLRVGTLEFTLPPGAGEPVFLRFSSPSVVLADLKVAGLLGSRKTHLLAVVESSPGHLVALFDPGRCAGSVILELPQDKLCPDISRLRFLQPDGRPVPDGVLALQSPSGWRPVRRGTLTLRSEERSRTLRFLFISKEPLYLDRILGLGPLHWKLRRGS